MTNRPCGGMLLFTSRSKTLDVRVVLLTWTWCSTCACGLTAALVSRLVLTLFRFPHCRTLLPHLTRPPLRLVSPLVSLLLEHAQTHLFPRELANVTWRSGGMVVHIQLRLTSGCTHWQNSASNRTWTRVLLILVLATTTTPRQCDRLTLKSRLELVFIIRTTVVYLPPESTRATDVPRMPRTPF